MHSFGLLLFGRCFVVFGFFCKKIARCRNTSPNRRFMPLVVSLCLAPEVWENCSMPQHFTKQTIHVLRCFVVFDCRSLRKLLGIETLHQTDDSRLYIRLFWKCFVVFDSTNARQWLESKTPPNRQFTPLDSAWNQSETLTHWRFTPLYSFVSVCVWLSSLEMFGFV